MHALKPTHTRAAAAQGRPVPVATAAAPPPLPPPPRRAAPAATTAAAALAASILLLTSPPATAAAEDATTSPTPPAALFARNCAGCHAGGGNVVSPGATLFAPDLASAGLDSPEVVFKLVYGGRGRMPGYGTDCAPKGQCTFGPRLSDGDITRLAEYVLAQAAGGWKE